MKHLNLKSILALLIVSLPLFTAQAASEDVSKSGLQRQLDAIQKRLAELESTENKQKTKTFNNTIGADPDN